MSLFTTVASILIITVFFVGIASGRSMPAVRFQTDTVATTESFLDTGPDGLPTLQQMSMCLHLKLRRKGPYTPLLSYAVGESDNEILIELALEEKAINVICCGELVFEIVNVTIKLFTWQHICVSLDLSSQILRLVYDDVYAEQNVKADLSWLAPGQRLEIKGGGRMVVGQEMDSPEGDFDVVQSLDGIIVDYRLYDVALSEIQMKEILACESPARLRRPIIDLEDGGLLVTGPTQTITMDEEIVCAEKEPRVTLLFPYRLNFYDADYWCRNLKGHLFLPKSNEFNTRMYDEYVRFSPQCTGTWTNLYWIGAFGNLTTLEWMTLTEDKSPMLYDNFIKGWDKVSAKFQCISMITKEAYKWSATACITPTCPVCNFTAPPLIRLRGMCEESLLERNFYFLEYENSQLVFDGQWHVRIVKRNNTWVMESRIYRDLKATLQRETLGVYPVGTHTWKVDGDTCKQTQVQMLLTFCSNNEYTCNDGTCIDKDRRCDLSIDCPDQSDELACTVIKVPNGYSAKLPPPKVDNKPLSLLISVNLTSVKEFNLVSFTISMDVLLQLKWFDQRLKYSNLRGSYRANKLKDFQSVWTPDVMIRDGTRSSVDTISRSESVYVARLSDPLPPDYTIVIEDDVYRGSQNMLVFEQEQTITFMCHFDLQMYPFDRQLCTIILKIQDLTDELCVLIKDGPGVEFLGTRRLLEYHLVSETFSNFTEDAASHIQIDLEFKNLYRYYLGNTFLPSLMLVIICCITLCFHLDDFQDRIMVSLTSLLVLATFFVQTSQSITKTSYLKLIDVWFVALICQDFFVIVGLVVVEIIRLRPSPGLRLSGARVRPMNGWAQSKFDDEENLAATLNKFLLIFFSVVLLILLACFVPVCALSLNAGR